MNRRALEMHLRPGELAFVREWCALEGVDPDTWPAERRLTCFIDIAVGRYRSLIGGPERFALKRAASDFGLSLEALRKRARRRRTRVPVDPPLIDLNSERAASLERRRTSCPEKARNPV